jgi:ATPase subunit of ABC transporter with duplicated ATPase domains
LHGHVVRAQPELRQQGAKVSGGPVREQRAERGYQRPLGGELLPGLVDLSDCDSEKQAAKARQTERLLGRMDVVAEPRKEWSLRFTIAAPARSGDIVATLRAATAVRGSFRLGPVDLQLNRLDRVAITGPNGGGKSTLLGILLGRLPYDRAGVPRNNGAPHSERSLLPCRVLPADARTREREHTQGSGWKVS